MESIERAIERGVFEGLRMCGLGQESETRREPGRPPVGVDFDDIELLRQLNFSWGAIANILGVSRSTIYRKIEEEGLHDQFSYTQISDQELDHHIKTIKLTHPNDGERMIIGHLCGQNIRVPRSRIRASIHRIDPTNVAVRRMITLRRRVYFSEGPNNVWHMDSHHKLIRWNIVSHGAIDGFSRTVVYLKCASNNKSTTVLNFFSDAVGEYGVPQKVRSDLGGENYEVWKYMIQHHMSDEAVIVGSSVHNERIERLWRDVFRSVSSVFYETFKELEAKQQLDPLNGIDLYCLHFVYLPRINSALKTFVNSWNNHPIRTEHNLTPNQLFIKGALEQDNTVQTPHQSTLLNLPSPNSEIEIPQVTFKPCHLLRAELQQFDPLASSQSCGMDIYSHVVNAVGQHLSVTCHNCNI